MWDFLLASLTNPRLWVLVLGITIFGVIEKAVFYEAGKRSGKAALNKVHGYTEERAEKFHRLYERWGAVLLLLASVPVIGSVTTVLGGVSGVTLPVFIILVAISNLLRNWLLVLAAEGLVDLIL